MFLVQQGEKVNNGYLTIILLQHFRHSDTAILSRRRKKLNQISLTRNMLNNVCRHGGSFLKTLAPTHPTLHLYTNIVTPVWVSRDALDFTHGSYTSVIWTLKTQVRNMRWLHVPLQLLFFPIGAETETQVCAYEEAAILHRRWWTGASRLPVGQFELDGSLLVQVWLKLYFNSQFCNYGQKISHKATVTPNIK